jgi:hypothetical protein
MGWVRKIFANVNFLFAFLVTGGVYILQMSRKIMSRTNAADAVYTPAHHTPCAVAAAFGGLFIKRAGTT